MKRKSNLKRGLIASLGILILCSMMFIPSVKAMYIHIAEVEGTVGQMYLSSPTSEMVVYSHYRWWTIIIEDNTWDLWLYNSTDRLTWYGVELDAVNELHSSWSLIWRTIAMCVDSEGDIHIAWMDDTTNGRYKKVELENDGSITNHATEEFEPLINSLEDIVVDGQDYPVILYYKGSAQTWIEGSTTKDGTWTQDYKIRLQGVEINRGYVAYGFWGTLTPVAGNSGKDMIVVAQGRPSTNNSYGIYSFYFNEVTENFLFSTLVQDFSSDDTDDAFDVFDRPNIIDKEYMNVNETFFTYACDFEGTTRELRAYRTVDGSQSWTYRMIYDNMPAGTDYIGHISKVYTFGAEDSYYVIYRHNDINLGNSTYFYSRISNSNMANFAVGAWDEWNIEVFDDGDSWEDYQEGRLAFSFTQSYCTYPVTMLIYGHDVHVGGDDCIHNYDKQFLLTPSIPPIIPLLLNVTINGMDDGWLFMGEVYEVDSYWNNTNYGWLEFTDTKHDWRFYWNNNTQEMWLDVLGFEGVITNEMVIGTIATNNTQYRTINRLQWKFILDRQVVDCFNQSITWFAETANISSTPFTGIYNATNDFHVTTADENGDYERFIGNQWTELVFDSHGRYWVIGYEDTSRHIWIWNSTDRINWYGTELVDHQLEDYVDSGMYGFLVGDMDSNGDLHIAYKRQGSTTRYIKVELEADGSITNLGSRWVYDNPYYPIDIKCDDLGYPVILLWTPRDSPQEDLLLIGSSTNNGVWTQDYLLLVVSQAYEHYGCLIPMSGNGGKDFIVAYSWWNGANWVARTKYFHEITETLSPARVVDDTMLMITNWGGGEGDFCGYGYRATGLDQIYQNNETFLAILGEVSGDRIMNIYRTLDGGVTWSSGKTIYDDMPATTDGVGHIIRMTSNNDLYVFYRHDDINEGNCTFLYDRLDSLRIATDFNLIWDDIAIQIYDTSEVYTQRFEGLFCWSVSESGRLINETQLVFGHLRHDIYTEPCIHILNSTYYDLTGIAVWGIYNNSGTATLEYSIYNLGGYAFYEFQGDGHRIVGGDVFELEVRNATLNSEAYAEQWYRKLQQVHLLCEFYTNMTWQSNHWRAPVGETRLSFGFDYRVNQSWVDGWRCEIYQASGNIGHWGVLNDHAWQKLNVQWYNRNILIKTEKIATYNYGWFPSGENQSQRHSIPLFIDIWFDEDNASTTVGGRVTPFYLGVKESGWWGIANWKAVYTEDLASSFHEDLLNENGNVFTCQYIEFVRFWARIEKISYDPSISRVEKYELFESLLAPDRMEGVAPPVYVEPKIPEMQQQFGFLAPLYRAIQGLARAIWMGALGFIKILWGAMDSLLTFLGFPSGTWSRLVDFFMNRLPSLIFLLLNNAVTMVNGLLSMLRNWFPLIVNILPRFIIFIGMTTTQYLEWWNQIVSLFTGGWTGIGNIWTNLELEEWVTLAIILSPFLWVNRLSESEKPLETMKNDLGLFATIFGWMFSFFRILLEVLLKIINTILGFF